MLILRLVLHYLSIFRRNVFNLLPICKVVESWQKQLLTANRNNKVFKRIVHMNASYQCRVFRKWSHFPFFRFVIVFFKFGVFNLFVFVCFLSMSSTKSTKRIKIFNPITIAFRFVVCT